MKLNGRVVMDRSLLALVTIALLGCSSGTEPRVDARVVVTETEIAARRISSPIVGSVPTVRFTLPWRVDNLGTEPVTFHTCPSGRVEVLEGALWTTAWGGYQLCTLVFAPVTVPPGESREFTLEVSARLDGSQGGWLRDEIDGIYRYTVGFVAPGPERILRSVHSNEFRLTETP